jgi:hypothetical protein
MTKMLLPQDLYISFRQSTVLTFTEYSSYRKR